LEQTRTFFGEKVLEAKNIGKTYKTLQINGKFRYVHALIDASFFVREGEILGFLGPNGAGKSTAIKIITSLAAPSSGEVFIQGHSVQKQKEQAMREVGGVIESPDLYVDMSGEQNLKYFGAITGGVENLKERIDEVLKTVGLYERRKDLVKKYSLGMKQRLGIAQAILRKPKLLILDEPANGLDPVGIKEIRDMLKKFAHEEGMAIMVSSHQLAEMELMCDRVIIINKGRIVGERSIEELRAGKGGASVIISTDNKALAISLLKEKFGIDAVEEGGDIVARTDEPVSSLTRELVLGGVNVYAVKKKEVSLEDAFFELTGGQNV
jgi:ABC-2 type transport system ATP-binding protein